MASVSRVSHVSRISQRDIGTPRGRTRILEAGEGTPVLLIHGNMSNADVYREQLGLLPPGYRGIAPDLRGFGSSEPRPIDATRGLRDFADDMTALLDELGMDSTHVIGHSMGGGVAMRMAIDHPDRVASMVLFAPVSPYGFGGTRADGSPCTDDWAGSGGGGANPDLVDNVRTGTPDADHPASPRNTVRGIFFPDPAVIRDEETVLGGIMQTRLGDDFYPGDATPSDNWPGSGPGTRGVLNTMSPRYCDLTAIGQQGVGGPILWLRGDKDAVVSNTSLTDLGYLGAIGAIPGWPGEDAFPAQPMVDQTRDVLAPRRDVREEVLAGVGHFPFTQQPEKCAGLIATHLGQSAAHLGE